MKKLLVMLLFISHALAALIGISKDVGSGNKSSIVEYSRDGEHEFGVHNKNYSNFDSKVSNITMGEYDEYDSIYDEDEYVPYNTETNRININKLNGQFIDGYEKSTLKKNNDKNKFMDKYDEYERGEELNLFYDRNSYFDDTNQEDMENNNKEGLYYDETNETYDSKEYNEMYIDKIQDEDVGKKGLEHKSIYDTNNYDKGYNERDTEIDGSYGDVYDSAHDSYEEYSGDWNNHGDSYDYHEKGSGKEMSEKDDEISIITGDTYDTVYESCDEYNEGLNNNYEKNYDYQYDHPRDEVDRKNVKNNNIHGDENYEEYNESDTYDELYNSIAENGKGRNYNYDTFFDEERNVNGGESSELNINLDNYDYTDYENNHKEIGSD
ncbi:hypothetical protein J6590_006627 [Homalodisca vitripennis]|nr:hypothetical protein J6590_006627 [Homalodisca vitripennis]